MRPLRKSWVLDRFSLRPVRYRTDTTQSREESGCMLVSPTIEVKAADRVTAGVVITFSDDVAILLPSSLLLELKRRPDVMLVLPAEDGF